jgi:hypothetical protein
VAAIFRFLILTRLPQLDIKPIPHDGRCRYSWWGSTLCHPWSNSRKHTV